MQIAILGDYQRGYRKHSSIAAAFDHASDATGIRVTTKWIPSAEGHCVGQYDGVFVAPQGAGYCRSLEGMLGGIRLARERNQPLLATCGGAQMVITELARNVLGLEVEHPGFCAQPTARCVLGRVNCAFAIGTNYDLEGHQEVQIIPYTLAAELYGRAEGLEEYACNYVLSSDLEDRFMSAGAMISARGPCGSAAILELTTHSFYVATAFVPQFSSVSGHCHQLIKGFVRACFERHKSCINQ